MYIDDIEGSRAKGLYRGVAKDILKKKDIDGASASPRNYVFSFLQFFNSIFAFRILKLMIPLTYMM